MTVPMSRRNFNIGDTCQYCTDDIPHCTWCGNVIDEGDRALSFVMTWETLHMSPAVCLAEYQDDYDTARYQDRD